jgi:hypothetical protein
MLINNLIWNSLLFLRDTQEGFSLEQIPDGLLLFPASGRTRRVGRISELWGPCADVFLVET